MPVECVSPQDIFGHVTFQTLSDTSGFLHGTWKKKQHRSNIEKDSMKLEGCARSFHPKIISPHMISPMSFHPMFISPHIHLTPHSLGGGGCERGRDISSPAIWATKISAHFGDNIVAQMSRRLNGQLCSHSPSAVNAGAKRSGATCHMAMPQCCYLAKGAKRPSHTTNMLTSSNISVN